MPKRAATLADWYKIIYVLVSSSRYALPSQEAIEGAFDKVAEMEAYFRSQEDTFGLGRALCEKTSLVLIVLYYDNLFQNQMTAALVSKAMQFLPHFGANI